MKKRALGCFAFVALMLAASRGDAGNQVTWTLHSGETLVTLPSGLFEGRALPTTGARWHCVADKALRQDGGGNTFVTLSIRCDDGDTTVSAAASCAIGAHETRQLSFELTEKAAKVKNAIRAECSDGV